MYNNFNRPLRLKTFSSFFVVVSMNERFNKVRISVGEQW